MSTALVFGNGNLLVNLDYNLAIQDLFWPHVGDQNHLPGNSNEMFFKINGENLDFNNSNWNINYDYAEDSLSVIANARNDKHKLELEIKDCVLSDKDILLRIFKFKNTSTYTQDIYCYFKNNFALKESDIGDTAMWYPPAGVLCHYKESTYIGIGSTQKIYQFSCAGPFDNNGGGCIPDENGQLVHNPVATGSVQSCISFKFSLQPGEEKVIDIFYAFATCLDEIEKLSAFVKNKNSEELFRTTNTYWKNWIESKMAILYKNGGKQVFQEKELNEKLYKFYKRSLLVLRTQTDNSGAIIAANDSYYLKQGGKDSYSYFWPRDGANAALAYIQCGYGDLAKKFFKLCMKLISKHGYFHHKYHPDYNLGIGSSWHPWIDKMGNVQLPIQLDETALVLYALYKHYERFADQEFLNEAWNELVLPAANFLYDYRYTQEILRENIANQVEYYAQFKSKEVNDKWLTNSKLPRPSYDIWEVEQGVFTYSVATVYAGLESAGKLALLQGNIQQAEKFGQAAVDLKKATEELLYDKAEKRFIKGIHFPDMELDKKADASLYALWGLEMFPHYDKRIVDTMAQLEESLELKTNIGGIARKESDNYLADNDEISGNPWFITTLWFTQYAILKGDTIKVKKYLKWVLDHADHTGLIAEQADPITGIAKSVKPLTWSHAEFIKTYNLLPD